MTDRQLRDEVVTLILAGHETTALVLFYTFYLLAQSPECADRLAVELREVIGDRRPPPAMFPTYGTPSGSFANRCVCIHPPGALPARL